MLFENLYRKHMFFMIEKAKQKLLFEKNKWFFKKIILELNFAIKSLLVPWPGFISENFDNFFDQ